ncbi:glycosyl transferase, partial [Arthrobacter deserti]|nr:glycosyl transferase [Arthrobacter deserti]
MHEALLTLYGVVQVLFLFSLLVTVWFLVQKVDLVQKADSAEEESAGLDDGSKPPIVMFYPVLKELESTMRTTFTEMAKASYPQHLLRVIAIPNDDDVQTIASLRR